MPEILKQHYERHPYPHYPLFATARRCDTYALNLEAIWRRFNGGAPAEHQRSILVAGCGSFAPAVFALANPNCRITALDLSRRSLKRARWHCLLHGTTSVRFVEGDLCDPTIAGGTFGLIDAYGVIHHLEDPLAGLQALKRRMAPGGILRLMVYSRYARREEEAIRYTFRLLGITTVDQARRMIASARPGSRLRQFADRCWEASFDEGIADALLHPRARTYRIDDLLDLLRMAELQPLLFAHPDSLEQPDQEIKRLRSLEAQRHSPGNFVMYLGRPEDCHNLAAQGSHLMLNPCLTGAVGLLQLKTLRIPPRIGIENPALDRDRRSVLRKFIMPQKRESDPVQTLPDLELYQRALFLIQFTP